jgi:hypothetical protein
MLLEQRLHGGDVVAHDRRWRRDNFFHSLAI